MPYTLRNIKGGHISKCLVETAYNASSPHGVDELKLKLSKNSKFYNGEEQRDCDESLLLLVDIMDKDLFPILPMSI